jgi:hypothetical protein
MITHLDRLIIDWQIRNLPPIHYRPPRVKPLHLVFEENGLLEYGRLRWDWPAGFGYRPCVLRRIDSNERKARHMVFEGNGNGGHDRGRGV